MGEVGIVTLDGYINYGNRLQNYALQKEVIERGKAVATLLIEKEIGKVENGSKLKAIIKMSIKEKMNLIKFKINEKNQKEINEKRIRIFKEFTNNYISEKKITLAETNKYGVFITGSDQVWNSNFVDDLDIKFLEFANSEKRIAYAPSFGISKIDDKYNERYKRWINGIKHISIREEAGAKIIKDLTGRDVEVLVDPTMLLNREDWLKVAKEDMNKPKKKYLLTYFLGGIPKEYKKYINKVAKENNLEIVDLANIKVPKYYVNGPSEFIDYINSADLFMTDSFHGCVFSMLMKTPFVVCKRSRCTIKEDMYSRIDTFVSKFKLESRQVENIKDENLFRIDYTESYKILEKEREKSQRFLNNALGIKSEV